MVNHVWLSLFFGLKDVTESTKVATQDLHIVGRPFKAVE
jgi:hypothetical protein